MNTHASPLVVEVVLALALAVNMAESLLHPRPAKAPVVLALMLSIAHVAESSVCPHPVEVAQTVALAVKRAESLVGPHPV